MAGWTQTAYTIWKDMVLRGKVKMDNYYGNICYCRRCNGVVHTIKKGDTLYLISKYYKVPIGEIMNANRNINVYNLQIGDEICIPVRRPAPAMENEDMTQIPYMTDSMNEEFDENTRINQSEDMSYIYEADSDNSLLQQEVSEDKLAKHISESNMTVGELVELIKSIDK